MEELMIRRDNIAARAELGRELIASGIEEHDLELLPDPGVISQVPDPLDLQDRYPDGLAPNPEDPDPQWVLSDPLPQADVLVITWTIAEQRALADVLTPGFSRARWTRYNRRFEEHYRPLIRRGAPASNALRLGSWLRTNIGQKSVICYKSELHLNQDG